MAEEAIRPADRQDPPTDHLGGPPHATGAVLLHAARIAAVAELGTIGLYLYLYRQTAAWQTLAAAGLAGVALAGTLLALWLAGRKAPAATGVFVLTVVLAYSSGE